MFSKLTMSLAVTMSLLLADSAFAQQKQKADAKATQAKQAEEAEEAAKKVEEEKALEAKKAAEKAKAEDSSGLYGYMKSRFSASYHGEFYLSRKDVNSTDEKDHDIQDLKIMHNPSVIYRPATNLKLLVTSEFKYTDAVSKGTFINRHYRSLVLFTRENVLTEKDDGIKMDVGVGRRIFDRNHGNASSYGNTRLNASLSKKVSDKLSSSLFVQYLANDPVYRKIGSSTWKHSIELIPSFTWQITDKLSYFFNDDFIINTPYHSNDNQNIDISHEMNVGVVTYQFNDNDSAYFQLKYLHSSGDPFQVAQNVDDSFEYYIGHTHSFTPKLSATAEVGSKIIGSKDGRDFFAKEAKYPEFALYLDYSL